MVAYPLDNSFEKEIADLSHEISARRDVLERERGIIETKDVLRNVIGEKLYGDEGVLSVQETEDRQNSQLILQTAAGDVTDEGNKEKLTALILLMRGKGLSKAIEEAKKEAPYIIDLFHDTLVDTLHDELKEQGYIP